MRNAIVGACGLLLAVSAMSAQPTPAPAAASRARRCGQDAGRARVRALLGRKADVNARSDDGSTALLWAAHWNDVATADLLIRAGADANVANDFGMTPLSRACTNGSAALVQLLLKAGANPNTRIATGETPIMTCASSGNADAVRMLHRARRRRQREGAVAEPGRVDVGGRGASSECGSPARRSGSRSSGPHEKRIHRAALRRARRRPRERTAVAGRGREREHPVAAGRTRGAPRREGSGGGRTASGTAGAGAAPRGPAYQATISAGSTPLLVATMRGHVPLALFLLEQGADPNVLDAGFTPLHWAAGTWEGGVSNPVYGFTDPMSGIPNRQEQAAAREGASGSRRESERAHDATAAGISGLGGGYEDAAGATPFLLASAAADLEMMRLLLAAGRRSDAGDRHEDDAGHGGVGPQSRDRRKPDHRSAGARGRQVAASSWAPTRREPPRTARTRCSARRIAGGTRCSRC